MNLNKLILFMKNVDGVGDSTIRKFVSNGCFENLSLKNQEDVLVWLKSHSNLFYKQEVINNLTLEDLAKAKLKRELIERKLLETGCHYISCFDEHYPKRFSGLYKSENSFLFYEMNNNSENIDYPLILYYKGDIDLLNSKLTCAVIGTRKPSDKAAHFTTQIAERLTEKGYVVISGLAEGCDAFGHWGCLNRNGKTVAFLGTGIDIVYPKSNQALAESILNKGGLLVSEYYPGFKGSAYTFVERDRLQTMSSDSVYVIQTSKNGGSMHAAKATKKYMRKLFVVDPAILDYCETDGNAVLINEYYGEKIATYMI